MACTGNQLVIHDQTYAVATALANLEAAIQAAGPLLAAAGATDIATMVSTLQTAIQPSLAPIAAASAAVVDLCNTTP